mgnify:FL=1
MQKELVSKILKNGTPHSRYFSDELGVPNFLIKTQNKCLPYRKTYCIIQIWKKKVGNFMQIVSSYGVEIKKKNIPLRATLDIFRKAVSYLIPVYAEIWEELSEIRNPQKRFNEAEHLVHETKKNHARFLFDRHFPKMPSYLRRAAIQHALGAVSSYQSRLSLWEKGELRGKPKLVCENHAMPVFYRDVMYKEAEPGEDAAHLKLFDGREWKWFQVKLLHTDMEYLRKKWSGKEASAPTLERKHHKYFLRFSYTEEVTLSKTAVKEQVICSVDLGINTDAVCSIMRADGTILGRKFINFSSDKDHLYHVLGRIRRFQREHSSRQVQSRWDYAKRLNMELSRKIATEITKYAVEYQARRYALEGILGTVQLFLQSEKHLENLTTLCKNSPILSRW